MSAPRPERVVRDPDPGPPAAASRRAAAPPLLFGAMCGAMVAARFETAALCVAVSAAAAAAAGARRPPGRWLAAIAAAAGLAIALNLYLVSGVALPGPRLFGAEPSAEGLRHGVLVALRLIGAATAVHGLRAAWPGERAADELARLAGPLERLRVPVREGRALVGLALRFVPLLVDEARRIGRLQELRAGRPPTGLAERLARRRAALIPTLVAALERADRTALALEARHYRLRRPPPGAAPAAGWRAAGLALAGTALVWRG